MTQHQIPLKKQGGIVVGHAIVDECDYDYLSQWVWRMAHGYAIRKYCSPAAGRTKCGKYNKLIHLPMHREVANRIGLAQSKEVDHINRIRLDNRRSNLRSATRQQQACNCSKSSNNTSGVVGVSWNKRENKWHARIEVNGKKKSLGHFDSLKDAADVRNKAVLEHHGEFGVLSEVPK
jgi:hypothetical protein